MTDTHGESSKPSSGPADVRVVRADELYWSYELLQEYWDARAAIPITEGNREWVKRHLDAGRRIPVVGADDLGKREGYNIEVGRSLAGTLSLLRVPAGDGSTWEIDVLVFKAFRGRGIASAAISAVLCANPDRKWEAIVFKNAFAPFIDAALKRCGFSPDPIPLPSRDRGLQTLYRRASIRSQPFAGGAA